MSDWSSGINPKEIKIIVFNIGHRKDIYKK